MALSYAKNHYSNEFLYVPAVSYPRRQDFILLPLLYTWLSNCPITITPFIKKTVFHRLTYFCIFVINQLSIFVGFISGFSVYVCEFLLVLITLLMW